MSFFKTLHKEFDEKFPQTQKEPTHFEDCRCWSCNNYRQEVESFIDQKFLSLLEEMEGKLPEIDKAHTYSSENAEIYRAFDDGQGAYQKRVRSLIKSYKEGLK